MDTQTLNYIFMVLLLALGYWQGYKLGHHKGLLKGYEEMSKTLTGPK